jgi:4-amino-4-deoxy-L-arabinose transferase-like glycosyltransferase
MRTNLAWRITPVVLVAFFVASVVPAITRPFDGLHGYGAAQSAWLARSHAVYGLSYTRGFPTYAIAKPPVDSQRYLDHPALPVLLDGAAMKVLGAHEWSLRVLAMVVYCAALLILLSLLRRIVPESTAMIAVLIYAAFPITQTFYSVWDYWQVPVTMAAWWNYFAVTGELRGVESGKRHAWYLAALLFIMPQLGWPSAFFAAAIGTHYVASRLWRRAHVDWLFAAMLAAVPLAGFALALIVLVAGNGWDAGPLLAQYSVRSDAVTDGGRTMAKWFGTQLEHVRTNYTVPLLLLAAAQLVVAPWLWWRSRGARPADGEPRLRFAWVLLAPGVMCLGVFTEVFWVHQTWYWPLSAGIALAAAVTITQLRGLVPFRWSLVGDVATALVVGLLLVVCWRGREAYARVVQTSPVLLEVFQRLNRDIPPDGALLAYDSYVRRESAVKKPFMRPEVAWYLDRRVEQSMTFEDITRRAADGSATYYLAEIPLAPGTLVDSLKQVFVYQFIRGQDFIAGPPTQFLLPEAYLFYLKSPLAKRQRGDRSRRP